MTSVLAMFAKAPEPGLVKTRLAAEIGADAAARVQSAFLEDLLARFRVIADRRVLACSPDVDHPAFAAAGWERVAQGEGDLGARLTRVCRALLADRERIVVIGSDSPTLPEPFVARAFEALDRAAAVIAPSFDGGYVLIGCRAEAPGLFAHVPWGTERVFDVTVRRLQAAGVPFEVLPFWYDVDDLRSLRGMANHLGVKGPFGVIDAPATARLVAELGLVESGVAREQGMDRVGREG